MLIHFNYPAKFTKQATGFLVQFIDLPEALTEGNNLEDATEQAIDCLEEVIANRIDLNLEIPTPSEPKRGQKIIPLTLHMAAKAALYLAVREKKISKVNLAKKLNCDEKEIRRLLDPHYKSKLPRIEQALHILGQRLSTSIISL